MVINATDMLGPRESISDQADQRSDHAEGGGRIGPPLVHSHHLLVAGRGLLDVVFQNAAHPVRVVGVHDQHDRLLEEGIGLLVCLLLQCQQAVFPGDLRQLYQLIHIHGGIKRLGMEHDLDMLGKGLGQLGITRDHDRQGAAHDDQDAGQIKEMPEAVRREAEGKHGALPGVDADVDDDAEHGKYQRQGNSD